MYHFFSAVGGGIEGVESEPVVDDDDDEPELVAPSESFGSGAATLSIDQLREVRPGEVEQAEDDSGDDCHDDHRRRSPTYLFGGGPGDLLELARDFIREVIEAIVAVGDDARDDCDRRGEERDRDLAG